MKKKLCTPGVTQLIDTAITYATKLVRVNMITEIEMHVANILITRVLTYLAIIFISLSTINSPSTSCGDMEHPVGVCLLLASCLSP